MGRELDAAANFFGSGIPMQAAQGTPGVVPGADGRLDSLAEAGSLHPTLLSHPRENGPRADGPRADGAAVSYPLPVMLRVPCVQLFYNLSDPGMEGLPCQSDPVRRFVGLKLTAPLARRDHHPQLPLARGRDGGVGRRGVSEGSPEMGEPGPGGGTAGGAAARLAEEEARAWER